MSLSGRWVPRAWLPYSKMARYGPRTAARARAITSACGTGRCISPRACTEYVTVMPVRVIAPPDRIRPRGARTSASAQRMVVGVVSRHSDQPWPTYAIRSPTLWSWVASTGSASAERASPMSSSIQQRRPWLGSRLNSVINSSRCCAAWGRSSWNPSSCLAGRGCTSTTWRAGTGSAHRHRLAAASGARPGRPLAGDGSDVRGVRWVNSSLLRPGTHRLVRHVACSEVAGYSLERRDSNRREPRVEHHFAPCHSLSEPTLTERRGPGRVVDRHNPSPTCTDAIISSSTPVTHSRPLAGIFGGCPYGFRQAGTGLVGRGW
ncbi:hypothetical protein GA0070215_1515 [Micromonospora marina]|uniref:Uncharacterized protein n=1 Tax=Micromonospora marina TaxID=307120 RepID=A0A1C5AN08_9ACTN|nr:hypothetical protein GA0070215_1515 [Micromonospora marina]